MPTYYLDTNILFDFIVERKSLSGRSLSRGTMEFLERLSDGDAIVISIHTRNEFIRALPHLDELSEENISMEEARQIFDMLLSLLKERLSNNGIDIKLVPIPHGCEEYAKMISEEYGIHLDDAMHVSIAIGSKEPFEPITIVTHDYHFNKAREIVNVLIV